MSLCSCKGEHKQSYLWLTDTVYISWAFRSVVSQWTRAATADHQGALQAAESVRTGAPFSGHAGHLVRNSNMTLMVFPL